MLGGKNKMMKETLLCDICGGSKNVENKCEICGCDVCNDYSCSHHLELSINNVKFSKEFFVCENCSQALYSEETIFHNDKSDALLLEKLKRIVIISNLKGEDKEKAKSELGDLVGGFMTIALGTQILGSTVTILNDK